jgi:metal-responsive CopG/Arc/MetJ family transcriptional regulator
MASLQAVVKENKCIELFVLDGKGNVWHTWQSKPNGSWWGAEKGKRNALWQSLGKPGR